MIHEVRVREASEGDAGVIAELNGIVQGLHNRAHPDRFLPADPERVEPIFRGWLTDAGDRPWLPGTSETKSWVAEVAGGEVVGYVIGIYRERPETPFTQAARSVELDQIAVREDCQHLGLGQALVQSVTDWAAERDVANVELTVWEFNTAAANFFGELGFGTLHHRLVKRTE